MENTYQDLITDIQSKNPKISGKLEGGKKFKIKSDLILNFLPPSSFPLILGFLLWISVIKS